MEQHELLGFDASRPLPNVIPERTNSLAVAEGVLSRFFQTTDTASKPRRGNAFRASRQVSENSELFKKLDPGVQFQWELISPAVQLRRLLRGSEAESTTNSRYRFFQGRERSLDLGRLQRASRDWRIVFNPSAYVDLQPLGLTGDEKKSDSPFVSTLRPPSRIGPSVQVFQQASGSPDHHTQTPVARTSDQFRSSWRSDPNHTWSVTSAEGPWKGIATPSKHRSANLRFYQN